MTVTTEVKLVHEPLNRSPRRNWVENAGQLPAYIQHIANDLEQERGIPLSRAIPIAIGVVKRWARGGGDVKPDTRAKAAAAVAEWEALKAKNRARRLAGKSAWVFGLEEKVVRHVRTEAGVRRFKQPLGSVIVRDGSPPIHGLIAVRNDWPGLEKVKGTDGKHYYIGETEEGSGQWAAWPDNEDLPAVVTGSTEESVYEKLSKKMPKNEVTVRRMTAKEKASGKKPKKVSAIPDAPAQPNNIKRVKSDFDGYTKYRGDDGNDYYVSTFSDQHGDYLVFDAADKHIASGPTETDAREELKKYVSKQQTANGIAKARERGATKPKDKPANLPTSAQGPLKNGDRLQLGNLSNKKYNGKVVTVLKDPGGKMVDVDLNGQSVRVPRKALFPVGKAPMPHRAVSFRAGDTVRVTGGRYEGTVGRVSQVQAGGLVSIHFVRYGETRQMRVDPKDLEKHDGESNVPERAPSKRRARRGDALDALVRSGILPPETVAAVRDKLRPVGGAAKTPVQPYKVIAKKGRKATVEYNGKQYDVEYTGGVLASVYVTDKDGNEVVERGGSTTNRVADRALSRENAVRTALERADAGDWDKVTTQESGKAVSEPKATMTSQELQKLSDGELTQRVLSLNDQLLKMRRSDPKTKPIRKEIEKANAEWDRRDSDGGGVLTGQQTVAVRRATY